MAFPVLKGASYALIHATDIIMHQGTTQTNEKRLAPGSDFLKNLPNHYRSFEEAVTYAPNQVFIGSIRPKELDNIPKPWYKNLNEKWTRDGKHGAMMPQDEFVGLIKAVDAFDLVLINETFANKIEPVLKAHPIVSSWPFLDKIKKNPATQETITEQINEHEAEPLYDSGELIGCVKKAHAFDAALSSHVMFENLVSKASAAFSLSLLFKKTGLDPMDVDYIIECSEEACGDMNQRGGGNFAKSIGEVCGCLNATGSDTRGFCAAPVHALLEASALVQSGIFKNVIVVAGGSSAKLGMNAKDHVKKEMPVLEDVIGAFAVHIGEDDKVSPVIRTDIVGKHTVGSGGSPQAVTQAIVADPLDKVGLKIGDIDTFSVEMHNPEVTEPAGAGDVPKSNYKMIAALGVMRKEFERSELNSVVDKIAMPGFAPTQGHIPSGVPFLAHCKDMMADGELNRVMIVGKGSLFLGRMTNLFDGVSFILEKNSGVTETKSDDSDDTGSVKKVKVGLTLFGSEHGEDEMLQAAEQAQESNPNLKVIVIGPKMKTNLQLIEASNDAEAHQKMDSLLGNGGLDAAVTMHYNFPIGVATVGRSVTPGKGKKLYLTTTTGTSDTVRVAALLKNTIAGISVAKACGRTNPTVGILNIDGANSLERILQGMKEKGYNINFTTSTRADATITMRGNDLLQGTPDVMVMDSLTGNVITKMLSAFSTGGNYESIGDGYGPGVGEGYKKIINIVSRASGAPVVAGAIEFAAACAAGNLPEKVAAEYAAAKKAGLTDLIAKLSEAPKAAEAEEVKAPPEKIVTTEIAGIEILELEDAVRVLWKKEIYATSGMGCTGPIILVAPEDEDAALIALKEAEFL